MIFKNCNLLRHDKNCYQTLQVLNNFLIQAQPHAEEFSRFQSTSVKANIFIDDWPFGKFLSNGSNLKNVCKVTHSSSIMNIPVKNAPDSDLGLTSDPYNQSDPNMFDQAISGFGSVSPLGISRSPGDVCHPDNVV